MTARHIQAMQAKYPHRPIVQLDADAYLHRTPVLFETLPAIGADIAVHYRQGNELLNGTIWLAILFLLGFTLCYMTAVSWADYSYVMPAGAFGYAVQTMLAVVVLHEAVNTKRWIGVIVICIGVLLVGQTKPSTTNNATVPS